MLKSLFTVSGWTGASRILGFVRDLLMAAVLGTGPIAEAFLVAFRLPNMFRRIFAEGAYAAAFVPLFTEAQAEDPIKAKDFANNAMAWLILVLLILTGLAVVFMPTLVDLLANGFRADPDKFDLSVKLGRIMFIYLMFMAVMAHISSVLNAFKHFAAAAAAPVLLNVFFIVSMLVVLPFVGLPGEVLAWTVALAGIAQVALVWWALRKLGFDLRLVLPKRDGSLVRLLKLMIPGTISAGVQQINLLIGTRLVSGFVGAVAFVSYADRVYQLPLGLIGIGLGIVLLPSLSRLIAAGEVEAARERLNRGLELCLLLSLPAAVALFVIAQPVVVVLFERGAFVRSDSVSTALALQAYAVGLPAFVVNKVMLPGYFARKNTQTPMYFAIASMVAFVVLALLLVGPYGFLGVAAATSIAAWVNVALLALGLIYSQYWSPDRRLIKQSLKYCVAALIMGFALLMSDRFLTPVFNISDLFAFLVLMVLIGFGTFAFFASAFVLRAFSPKDLRGMLRRS